MTQNWSDEIKSTIVDTLRKLHSDWSIDVRVEFHDNLETRSYHKLDRHTGKHVLVFGIPMAKHCWNNGVNDKCAMHTRGVFAIRALACHEYAHAVQTELYMRHYKSVHNQDFYDLYWEMLQDIKKATVQ